MNFRNIEYFFTKTTSSLKKYGTRFLDADRPNELTFRDLFKSIVWRTEQDNRAKTDVGQFDPSRNGHVVLATKEQVQTRAVQASDRSIVVAPANLPHVVTGSNNVTVSENKNGDNIVYSIAVTPALPVIVEAVGDNVSVQTNVEPEAIRYKVSVEEQGVLVNNTDTIPSRLLSDKIKAGNGLEFVIAEPTVGFKTMTIQLLPPNDSPVYYIDSNNTDASGGSGSILNSFSTLERFLQRIDGELSGFAKVTTRVTAVVRAGVYNISANTNLWRGVNYYFEPGVTIIAGASTVYNYLFDANLVDLANKGGELLTGTPTPPTQALVTSYPNVFGYADFILTDRGLYSNKPEDWETQNINTKVNTFTFSTVTCTVNNAALNGAHRRAINLHPTGYLRNGEKHLVHNFVGNTYGRRGTLTYDCSQHSMLHVDNTGGDTQFTFTSVDFYDSTSSRTDATLVINNATFGVVFSNCTFTHRGSAVSFPTNGFMHLKGANVYGLVLENCHFFHGNKNNFTCITMETTVSSSAGYIRLNNVTYIHSATVGSANKFVKEVSGGNFKAEFTQLVSYGGIYNSADVEYTNVAPNVNTKLDFVNGGVATLNGKRYMVAALTV